MNSYLPVPHIPVVLPPLRCRLLRLCLATLVIGYSATAAAGPPIDTSPDRAKTNLNPGLEPIGTIRPRSANEISGSNWTLGCETLDRDYADYQQYKEYLVPLGIKTIRLQGGWAKTEKVKGTYDFTWLDTIIDDARGRGLNILLETGYGNTAYSGGGGWDLAGGFPTSAEGLAAWDRWVEALATRYKGRVRDWAMWNEPDINKQHKPADIAAFNIRTAEIIKRVIPDARIAGLSLASSSPKLLDECLKVLAEKGKVDLFHWFIYHGYAFNPDSSYKNVEALKATLAKYSTTAKMRQGENGCPSEKATKFALSNHPWTEYSQAKWDLRRMLGDLGHDVESAVFTICDFNHTGREINRKGLLRATADKKVEKIKLAYYSVQNCVAVFDDTLERIKEPAVTVTFDKPTACFAYRNKKTGQNLLVLWENAGTPNDSFATRPAQVAVQGLPIKDPVWVDLVSGRVYEIPTDRIAKAGAATVFKDVPLYDAPVLIAARAVVPLDLAAATHAEPPRPVLVEAESFTELGGWVIDQQSMDQMGSPYVLAHGLGVPVADATTQVKFPQPGSYRLWVRTRDWVAPWKTPDSHPDMKAVGTPGVFQVLIAGKAVATTFGTEGAAWHWQDGGRVEIPHASVTVALHDLTGFAGRCDALLFTAAAAAAPPNDPATLAPLRRKLRGLSEAPRDAGTYDLVVVGGGCAGCCAAVSAARLGCKVALIHDRPVLGGNNSSEVRVGLSGLIHQPPYPRLGDLVDEWGPVGHWPLYQAKQAPDLPRSKEVLAIIAQHPEKKIHNAGPASNYEDEKKLAVVRAEKNLTLFLSTRANGVQMAGKRIAAVIAEDIRTGERWTFQAKLVADCTGDGVIGALAGADFAYGRESREQYGEETAPLVKDDLVMGTSVQWYAEQGATPSSFTECPWALPLNERTCVKTTRGDWDWETGATRNHITEIEHIRDYGLRVVYGNWAVLKNHPRFKDEFARQRLKWVAYIGGKRESRRLLGDVILRQQDVVEARPFPDASVTTTWTIDLHYPKESLCACEAFRSEARHIKIKPYPIPYRCLYSRNIENLLMAGRNISVTHVALGTVRVMRTGGMMGEVLGMAASLCQQHDTTPRGVYEQHLAELEALMQRGVGKRALR